MPCKMCHATEDGDHPRSSARGSGCRRRVRFLTITAEPRAEAIFAKFRCEIRGRRDVQSITDDREQADDRAYPGCPARGVAHMLRGGVDPRKEDDETGFSPSNSPAPSYPGKDPLGRL